MTTATPQAAPEPATVPRYDHKCINCLRDATRLIMREKADGPILRNIEVCADCEPRAVAEAKRQGETVRVFGIAPNPCPRPTLEQLAAYEREHAKRRAQNVEDALTLTFDEEEE